MDQFKQKIIIGLVCLGLGLSATLFRKPNIEYKEVIKTVTVESKAINKNTKTEIVEKKNKDGSIEKHTIIVNNDKIESKKDTKTDSFKELIRLDSNHNRWELYVQSTTERLMPSPHLSYTYQSGFVFARAGIEYRELSKIIGSVSTGVKLEY